MTSQPPQSQKGQRVRAIYYEQTATWLYQDPDAGNIFISRREAARRLKIDQETGLLLDSFGSSVDVRGISHPERGVVVRSENAEAFYSSISGDPSAVTPGPHEELIERTIIARPDGSMTVEETSFGTGKSMAQVKRGDWWRAKVSNALNLPAGERVSTSLLKTSVVKQEYLLKSTKTFPLE